MDTLLNRESDNERIESPPEVYSGATSKFPYTSDFHIEIQGFKTKSLFDTGVHASCISKDCYNELNLKIKIDTNIRV